MSELKDTVIQLISLKKEGEYWDFKRQWYADNRDMILDIICMANNIRRDDAYIIIGVDENSNYSICDVQNDPKRKSQSDVIDTLHKIDFAGGIRPDIELHHINIEDNKIIDIIVIKNSYEVPFYLNKEYGNKDKNKQPIKPYYIYSRRGCRNTPCNEQEDINIIERLWRKRFGIDLTVKEKMSIVLDDFENWKYELPDNNLPIYSNIYPEFHIKYETNCIEQSDNLKERYCGFFLGQDLGILPYIIYYHSTPIYYGKLTILDGFRLYLPEPKETRVRSKNILFYYYIEKQSIEGKMLKLLSHGSYNMTSRYSGDGAILLFDNSTERKEFENYVMGNLNEYECAPIEYWGQQAIEYEKGKYHEKLCESMSKLYSVYKIWKKRIN